MGDDYSNWKGSGSEGYSGRVATNSRFYTKIITVEGRKQDHKTEELFLDKEFIATEDRGSCTLAGCYQSQGYGKQQDIAEGSDSGH